MRVVESTPAQASLEARPAPMLETPGPSLILEHLGVPHRRATTPPAAVTGVPDGHPLTAWPAVSVTAAGGSVTHLHHPPADHAGPVAEHRLGDVPLFAHVVADEAIAPALYDAAGDWRQTTPVLDAAGRHVASVWRDDDGNALLPFNPDDVVRNLLSERYQRTAAARRGAWSKTAARRAYYRIRPLLPRRVQIALRRAYAPVQRRSEFPRWPVEPALHDFCDTLLALLAELAGTPLPYIAPWPGTHEWALVLTHDVETAAGIGHIRAICDIEVAAGCRSSWNLVPERYTTGEALVRELTDAGFEIGVHGLRHDGLDLDSLRRLRRRLPAMQRHRDSWGADGFRAPALHRRWEWMPMLGFDYDSSYPDTDPYEPLPGGCCSWHPFFNGDLVELPVTLPQDHTVFVLLGEADERLWSEKTEALRARGGMALIITHPDYMGEPGRLAAYERFVNAYASDATAWRALPREVASWWRRRAASRIEQVRGVWTVVGPAAGEARIAFAGGAA